MKNFKKIYYIFAIILIGIFELYVLYEIFHPETSYHYRLYFIEKKLASWSHGKGILYTKGDVLTHISIERFLSRDGWSGPEETIRWSNGNKAVVYIIFNDINQLKGTIKLRTGTLDKQKIILTINDHYIGSQTVDSRDVSISFKFNPEFLYPGSANSIQFEFPNARKPGHADQRKLAIALKSFIIE